MGTQNLLENALKHEIVFEIQSKREGERRKKTNSNMNKFSAMNRYILIKDQNTVFGQFLSKTHDQIQKCRPKLVNLY